MLKNNQIKFFTLLRVLVLSAMVATFCSVDASTGIFKKGYKRKPSNYKNKLYRSNLILEGKVYYGYIISHHVGMEIYSDHFPAFEVSLTKATYGQKFWQQMFNYPWIGISYWHSGFGNSAYLGTANAIFPYLNFPLIVTDNINIGFRIGAGIGYLSEKFDRLENYKHLAIGTHLNFAGNLTLELRWQASERFVLTGGISLTHFSNGAFKLPNYGINIPAISIGMGYWLQKSNKPINRPLYSPVKPFEFHLHRTIEFDLTGVFGFKDMEAVFGGKHIAVSVFGNLFKPISYKSKLGIGFDVSYDGSDRAMLERNNIDVANNLALVKTGLNFGYELSIDRLSFNLNYGFYLSGRDQSDGTAYHKLSVRYNITKKVFANITLKTHWGKADYIGWGIGYRFKWYY